MRRTLFLAILLCSATVSAVAGDLLHVNRYLGKAEVSSLDLNQRNAFYWSVGTQVQGSGRILNASQEFSCGVSQADYRICTYEDGSPIIEEGKYFFNMSARSAGVMSAVFSYDINTCNVQLIGAVLGYKDGVPHELVAPHIMYNRQDGLWYVFAHWDKPHHLCVGKCYRDPRYGYNEVHATLLDYEGEVKGDEDNFIYYDSDIRRWVLIYSKASTAMSRQESKKVDAGYRLVCTQEDVKTLTGINVVKVGGKRYIVAGSMWKPEEDAYKVFDAKTLEYLFDLNIDIPTGGFRGWGTLLGITEGMETKYMLMTFDRANPTPVNRWQYGNLYMYEALERNPGSEYDLRRQDGKIVKADAVEKYTPDDLHFRRKFSQRLNFSQSIKTGVLSLDGDIFLKNGNVYPIKDNIGQVKYVQDRASLLVEGEGSVSLLGGTHLPMAEYVIDLSGMCADEVRYLKIGTMQDDIANIRFVLSADEIIVYSSDKEILRFPSSINMVRVILKSRTAYFFDAV